MRTEQEILADQTALIEDYRASHAEWSDERLDQHNKALRALKLEMRELYIQGAIVHDFIIEYAQKQGIENPQDLIYASKASENRFEIAVDLFGETIRSRGFDQASAVSNWNNKIWYVSPQQLEKRAQLQALINADQQ